MIKNLLKEGFILKTKGYYKHAIESFYKALELENTSPELLYEIAECYYLMADEERALSYIEQVLDKYPTHIESLKLLKKVFMDKNALSEAEQTAKNIYCISNEPEHLAEIFELLNKQNRYSEIFEYNIKDETPEILYEKACAKMYLKEYNEAENYINMALTLTNENKYLVLKGKILYKQNRWDECSQMLQYIKLDKNSDTFNFLGLVHQSDCNFKKAIEYFKEAIKLAPSNDEYYYNCASTYFKMADLQMAKKYYNLAISLSPNNQNYHFALANVYYSEKNYKRALEELDYDLFEAKLLKSIILYDSGYLAIAKREMDKLTKIQPDNELLIRYREKIEEELRI